MTVQELIAMLSVYHPQTLVLIESSGGEYPPVRPATITVQSRSIGGAPLVVVLE